MSPPASQRASAPGRTVAAVALLLYGVLVLIHALVSAQGPGETSAGELSLAIVHLAVAMGVAAGLRGGRRWAWWCASALGGLGLFFLLPVALGILLGGGREMAGTVWALVFFLTSTGALTLLVAILVARRQDFGDGASGTPEA